MSSPRKSSHQRLLRGVAPELELPPDCTCSVCEQPILATAPRLRCSNQTCDDVLVCEECAAAVPPCPTCGSSHERLYRDRASPFVLRTRVFREAFIDDSGTDIVHPSVMVDRALITYCERPLLGEPGSDGSVHWWSYGHCRVAAMGLARNLRRTCGDAAGAVLICATNSAGWLVVDWACALALLPSIITDASLTPSVALSMARGAAALRGRIVTAVCADKERITEWQLLCGSTYAIGDGSCRFDSAQSQCGGGKCGCDCLHRSTDGVAVFSTADAHHCLQLAASTATAAAASILPDDANSPNAYDATCASNQNMVSAARGGGGVLVTCLFSFGSAGQPKPLWFDSERCA